MLRVAVLFLVLGSSCKPQQSSSAEQAPGWPPASGMSVTRLDRGDGSGGAGGGKAGSGSTAGSASSTAPGSGAGPGGAPAVVGAAGPADAGVVDASLSGGNGSPAVRGDDGRVRGPGGPVFMGRGYDCTDKVDHCLRDGVWFAVDNLESGKLYRATPIFEFERAWYTWRGKEATFTRRLKTRLGTASTVKVGEPIVWLIAENAAKKWLNNEYDALTSSRWVAGYVQSIEGDRLRVHGWTYGMVPIDTTRVILESK